jgi:hypothetical protein
MKENFFDSKSPSQQHSKKLFDIKVDLKILAKIE